MIQEADVSEMQQKRHARRQNGLDQRWPYYWTWASCVMKYLPGLT